MNIKFALGDLCACADLSEPRLSSGVATNCCLGAHRKLSLIIHTQFQPELSVAIRKVGGGSLSKERLDADRKGTQAD